MNWANIAGNANIKHAFSDNIAMGYTLGITNYFFEIDGSKLAPGIYFYTVKFNNESITNKMVVE